MPYPMERQIQNSYIIIYMHLFYGNNTITFLINYTNAEKWINMCIETIFLIVLRLPLPIIGNWISLFVNITSSMSVFVFFVQIYFQA